MDSEFEKSFVTQMKKLIATFRSGLAVSICLGAPNSAFLYASEWVEGKHAISITLVSVGDDIEVYYMNPWQTNLTPEFKADVVKMIKFIQSGDINFFEAYWAIKNALRDCFLRIGIHGSKELLIGALKAKYHSLLQTLRALVGPLVVDSLAEELSKDAEFTFAKAKESSQSSVLAAAGFFGESSRDVSGFSSSYFPTSVWRFFTQDAINATLKAEKGKLL